MRLALAALGPLAAVAPVSTAAHAAAESEVVDTVQARLDMVGAPSLLVCAAGEETEKAARRMLGNLDEELQITRVPILGDIEAESERVRTDASAACAVWLRKADDGWDFGTVGPCTPPPAPVDVSPVVATSPTDSLEADPDETTVRAATAEPAPAPPPAPAGPVEVVLPPKLAVTDLALNPADHHAVNWHVVDTRGIAWSAPRFAETMGDAETLERLARDRKAAATERKVLFWSGIAGLAISPVPLVFTEAGAYGKNADLAWTSLFLVTTGGFTLALHKVGDQSEKKRQLRPAQYYSRADSEALVAAYNARIDAKQAELDAAREATPVPDATGAVPRDPTPADGEAVAPAATAPVEAGAPTTPTDPAAGDTPVKEAAAAPATTPAPDAAPTEAEAAPEALPSADQAPASEAVPPTEEDPPAATHPSDTAAPAEPASEEPVPDAPEVAAPAEAPAPEGGAQ